MKLFGVIGLVLGAAAARILFARETGYHFDEEWHYLTARLQDPQLTAAEWKYHTHPPLYFFALKLCLAVHSSFAMLRGFSIACSLLSLAMVAVL